jgi:protoporphyrinogen oxidase
MDGDRDINNQITLHLRKYQNNLKKKKLISINTEYKKSIYLKDSTGDASEYKLEVTANINVNSEQKLLISESFNMKKMTNLFDQSNYEKTIKKNFADSIIEKLLLKLAISNDI